MGGKTVKKQTLNLSQISHTYVVSVDLSKLTNQQTAWTESLTDQFTAINLNNYA